MKRMIPFLTVVLTFVASCSVFAGITLVTPSNMDGWTFYTTDNNFNVGPGNGSYGIVTGPATPPLGSGSAYMATAANHGDEEVQLRNTDWAGTPIASLTSLSYSTYATASNAMPPAASQDTFFDLYINTNGNPNAGYNDRLIFEPVFSAADAGNGNPSPQADPQLNTWQSWNLLTGMWYDDNGPSGPGSHAITWSDFLSLYPNAVIVNDDGNGGIGGLRVTIGAGGATDNFAVNVDKFTIGTASGTTTYNFDPAAVPESSSIAVWGLMGLVGVGGYCVQQKRKASSETAASVAANQ
jgi:hypothetical protein